MAKPYDPKKEPLADYNSLDTRVLAGLDAGRELPRPRAKLQGDSEDPFFVPKNLATIGIKRLTNSGHIGTGRLLTEAGEEYLERQRQSLALYPDVKSAMGLYLPARLGILDHIADHGEIEAPTRREAAEIVLVEAEIDVKQLSSKIEQSIGGMVTAELLDEDEGPGGVAIAGTEASDEYLNAVAYFFPGRPHGGELLRQHFAHNIQTLQRD